MRGMVENGREPYAWELAKEAFQRDGRAGGFERLLGNTIAFGGHVWSSPNEFLMAYPVRIETDGSLVHDDEDADLWVIHLAALRDRSGRAGSAERMGRLLETFHRLLPYSLPWVGWHRHGNPVMRIYRWDKLLARFAPVLR